MLVVLENSSSGDIPVSILGRMLSSWTAWLSDIGHRLVGVSSDHLSWAWRSCVLAFLVTVPIALSATPF